MRIDVSQLSVSIISRVGYMAGGMSMEERIVFGLWMKRRKKMVVGSLGLFISLEPLGGRRRRGQERGGFGGVAPNGKGRG